MSSSNFSPPPPFVFSGENYHIWVVKMRTYLQAHDLWDNPTIAQIKHHSEECAKKYKVMSCIQDGVSDVIFTRTMACETPKQAWDKLKEEFMGSEKTSIRLLGDEFSDKRTVEKVITTLPEKYESKISSLEDSRDLSSISLSKLINALYAQEQRRTNREEEHAEGAFQAWNKDK
ncbi:hypothetical protein HRI_004339500 [Hibiscus trionum]|uniref:DUF4219 domain-containing protein n=1 Tax=Hibiscus trionum TaxID=183268 RepID=A0A9W7J5E0_HIBTR|nr:hypothetical protein HRI_004339500 [Hibiscus trionum]